MSAETQFRLIHVSGLAPAGNAATGVFGSSGPDSESPPSALTSPATVSAESRTEIVQGRNQPASPDSRPSRLRRECRVRRSTSTSAYKDGLLLGLVAFVDEEDLVIERDWSVFPLRDSCPRIASRDTPPTGHRAMTELGLFADAGDAAKRASTLPRRDFARIRLPPYGRTPGSRDCRLRKGPATVLHALDFDPKSVHVFLLASS